MAVRFLLGRAGTGKTQTCLQQLRSAQVADPQRPLILLVPEQASFQMERALALPDGLWRAQVLSFSRLASAVLSGWIDEEQLLPSSARPLVLRMLVARDPAIVRHFGPAARQPGFFAALERLFGEFFAEQVRPEQLQDASAELLPGDAERVAALGGLFHEYLEWLGPHRCDPGQRLSRLRQRLPQVEWLQDASIWVDGFAGFTGEEFTTLVQLAGQARDMTISLLVDPEDSPLFTPVAATHERLRNLLEQGGVPVEDDTWLDPQPPLRFQEAPPLAWLEAGLARQDATGAHLAPEPDRHVALTVCETHREELETAAAYIRRRVLLGGGNVRYRDFALVTRDLERFAPLVADVMARFEIPYFLDRRRPLAAHVLVRFLGGLLEAVEHDYPPATMQLLLQLELLPMRRSVAEQLLVLLRRYELRGGHNWSRPRWTGLGGRSEPEDVARQRLRVFESLSPLFDLAAGGAQPGHVWAVTLDEVLERLRVRRRLEKWIRKAEQRGEWETAAVHAGAWEALTQVLQDLHTLTGPTPLTLVELQQVLVGALAEQTVGLTPPALDEVLVGAIDRTRHPDVRCTWLFAANEGIFPSVPREEVLLRDEERERLAVAGVPLPLVMEQTLQSEPLLFYVAATRPSETLRISYAKYAADGSERQPSPLLANLRAVLPSVQAEPPDAEALPTSRWSFARNYLAAEQQRGIAPRDAARYHALRAAQTQDLTDSAALAQLLRGSDFNNRTVRIPYHAEQPEAGAPVWEGSISELRSYQDCPFRHFLKYGLRIPERVGPTPLAIDLGNLGHDVLADVITSALRQDLRKVGDETWLGWLESAAAARAASLPPEVREQRPDLAYLNQAVVERLHDTVLSLAERYRRSSFRPLAVEQPFGAPSAHKQPRGKPWAALRVDLDADRFGLISGYIDRIDRVESDDGPHDLVVDYKPRVANVRGAYLQGNHLQLLTYLLAVSQHGQTVAGCLLSPLYLDPDVFEKDSVRESPEAEQRLWMLRPRGVVDHEQGQHLDDKYGPGHESPLGGMRVKNDGTPYASSDALSDGLDDYLDLTRRTLQQSLTGLVQGDVPVAPLVHRRRLACSLCTYRTICRFERVFGGARPAERSLPQLGEAQEEPPCS